uniref:Collagen, type XIV, alpha 1b n=1 Tax=Oryzias melastigma TaxID=30732 RepID=A0A3B3DLZ9_ORYME
TRDVTDTSFVVSWTAAPGNVRQYRIKWKSLFSEETGEKTVAGDTTTADLEGLTPETRYQVSVFARYGHGEGQPLTGEETTDSKSYKADSEPYVLSDVSCRTSAKADIVLLVDGSWSIGRLNFKTIRSFIARMVGVFDIGPNLVQIGLAQYSGDPKTEWHLNDHQTRESLLEAVAKLPYKGGNTMTGLALNYILQNNFKESVGMRPAARKIGVLITDGKSQDEVILTSKKLRDAGIELYAIGVKNADENELRSIATDPDEIHMYNVADFSFLLDIVDGLTDNLCNSVKGSDDGPGSPTDLVTSEVTHESFRATWTGPEGPVEKYRVEYMTVSGFPLEVFVDGTVTTVVLRGLDPLTQYLVNVYSIVGEESSDPLKGTETTRKSVKVRFLGGSHATHPHCFFMRVGAGTTDVQLVKLLPNTAYELSLFALYGLSASDPLIQQGVTCMS